MSNYDSWKLRSPDDDLYHGSAWEFADEADESQAACTCRLAPVHPTDIDSPEMIVNCDCPVHGNAAARDPDEALSRSREGSVDRNERKREAAE